MKKKPIIKYTHPLDKQYLKDSQSFSLPKKSFTESDLNRLHDLRRLLFQLHSDESTAAKEYDTKVKRLLSYRFKATANEMVQFEIDILKRCIGDKDFIQPTSEETVVDVLNNWLFDAFAERLKS